MLPRLHEVPFLAPEGFVRLAYVEWGAPRGPTVVCAHGLTRNARDFDALAAQLAAQGRRVVCVDFPGRGRSQWLSRATDYGYPVYLTALATLLARLDVASVDWIGTSMGGLAGMLLAAQSGGPIRRLVVNDVGPFIPKASLERIATYVGQTMTFPSLRAVEHHLRVVAAPFGPLTDAQWRHLAAHSARPDGDVWRLRYDPAIALPFTAAPIADVDLWPVWDRIAAPTLVLRGAESDLLLAETAAEMTTRGPRATVVDVPGCGHAPALMDASQIEPIVGFLDA
ncbi:MAG: alpha/beta hydrolase [Alphaproteobacteria bacterium]|nr:alpha/beta hydrolase [Alphaproteobacteria bacterium]